MSNRALSGILVLVLASAAQAGDLAPDVATKFLKLIASGSGGKVFAREPGMKAALEAAGVSVDVGAKVHWCTTILEVKAGTQMKRLCVVGQNGLLSAGAAVSLTDDGGRPKISINKAAVDASGTSLPDMIFKVSQ